MNRVKIIPNKLKGTINIPPSKSLAHRAVIAAALCSGESEVSNLIYSKDITATLKGMENLGAKTKINSSSAIIKGEGGVISKRKVFDCEESGSTIRFLIPLSLAVENDVKFIGKGKLVSRPQDVYYKIFDEKEVAYSTTEGELPLRIKGKLSPGRYNVKGNISSQFITGLLFTLPLLDGDSVINITTDLESIGYVDLTLDILQKFGVEIINNDYKSFEIKGNQKYKSVDYRVEGDFSQAAFWLTAGIIGTEIQCSDINLQSLQGDKAIIDIIREMNGHIEEVNGSLVVKPSKTKGTVIDVSQCPDLVPILAVLASLSEGKTEIINAERLRIKESDRLKAITTELKKLGADINEVGEGLVINGKESLQGGQVESWNDHRIAMALAIASIRCKDEVIIDGSKAVEKSYPNFWQDFEKLGGNIVEWSLGK
ncbi:3-phosphoshikimate 1-carboxyvinyltransferase [Clostridium sediminicola]|uniref:3-phosphoshikimate 1-carboxyvinyltransferase n=1 Tax=Clostridium sediminicola TaxID=3114879 RepID=UPI0031F1F29E